MYRRCLYLSKHADKARYAGGHLFIRSHQESVRDISGHRNNSTMKVLTAWRKARFIWIRRIHQEDD